MTIERKILGGFAIALLILLAIGILSYWSSRDLVRAARQVAETHEVLENIASVATAILDVQSSVRGYVITGRDEYLIPHQNASGRLRDLVASLRRKTAENVDQQRRLDELGPLVTERIKYADETIRIRREQGAQAAVAVIQSDRGKQLTDVMRQILNEMENEERKVLQAQTEEVRGHAWRTFLALASGSLAAIAIISLAIWTLQRDFRAREEAEKTLQDSENKYRDLVDNSGVIICTHDKAGKILTANRALVNAVGFDSIEEVVGMNLADFLSADVAGEFPKYLDRVLNEGRAKGLMKIRTRSGDERFLEYNNSLRFDPQGPPAVRGTALDVTERLRAEKQVQQSREDLAALVNELQLRSLEITRLSEISDLLQSCQNPEEAYQVTAQTVPKMFPFMSGALCIFTESRNVVEAVATWGPAPLSERAFSPDDCWALRRGRPHFVQDATMAQRCKHVEEEEPGSHLCVPMLAHGETVGIFYLRGSSPRDLPTALIEAQQRMAVTIGEQVGMSLANLKLRETLRQQSIRDPLTGLYNRRYMEESLERELRRATRNKRSMAVMMLDIDHFKRFNDTFGHDAGDALLCELGHFLAANVRGDDIACRYGGEEFALIFPESTLDSARQRAQALREGVKKMQVKHKGADLGVISISVGVASYPEHDSTPRGLLHVADQALYRAKREGRDRVIVAGSNSQDTPPSIS